MDKWDRFRLEKKGLIVVVSIHHTGTNFTMDEILRYWESHHAEYELYNFGIPHGKARVHMETRFFKLLDFWCKNACVIVPMRHPEKVIRSWIARNKRLEALAIQYDILKTRVDPYDPLYLPIDSPDRERWLDRLRAKTGKPHRTDWRTIMSCGKSPDLNDKGRLLLESVTEDGFFDKFYPELANVRREYARSTEDYTDSPTP